MTSNERQLVMFCCDISGSHDETSQRLQASNILMSFDGQAFAGQLAAWGHDAIPSSHIP